MTKILFISHDASRTGATILLLKLLTWLKTNTSYQFDLLLLNGGVLERDFKEICNTFYYFPQKQLTLPIRKKVLSKLLRYKYNLQVDFKNSLLNNLKTKEYDLIYGNTIVTTTVINELISFNINKPIVIHIHELYSWVKQYEADLHKLIKDKSNRVNIITVSELCYQNLVDRFNVDSNNISIINEYIDLKSILKFKEDCKARIFTVIGSGYVQYRKGYDLFILIAQNFKKKYPDIPISFKWIGKFVENNQILIEEDINKLGLTGILEFVGEYENPFPEYNKSSVFLLTSREDPFPLVCLENAALGKPIICFDKGTGIVDFVKNDAGVIAGYFDIESVVDAIFKLYTNKDLYDKYSISAEKYVRKHDINNQAPKILNIMTNILN
jgi:glycosyltransferase involved in cell wall biosynthesis